MPRSTRTRRGIPFVVLMELVPPWATPPGCSRTAGGNCLTRQVYARIRPRAGFLTSRYRSEEALKSARKSDSFGARGSGVEASHGLHHVPRATERPAAIGV